MTWPEAALGDIAEIVTGFPFSSAKYAQSGVRLARGKNVKRGRFEWSFSETKYWPSVTSDLEPLTLREGDVLIGMDGSRVGENWATVSQADLPALLVQRVARVRAKAGNDQGFIRYIVGRPAFSEYVRAVHTGTSIPHISVGQLRSFRVPVPPLAQQRAIGETLGTLDSKIASNQRLSSLALALARAHVDRQTAGRELVSLSTVLKVMMGSAFKGETFSSPGTGRPLLRIRDLKTFESQTWTTESRPDETVIKPGDVVVGMDAEFRATLWLGKDSVLNQRVCSFSGINGTGRAFTLAALEPELAFQERAKTGTTVIHLNKGDIDSFLVPNLSKSEHVGLAATTEPLIDVAVARSLESRALAALLSSLQRELLAGEVRITEAMQA